MYIVHYNTYIKMLLFYKYLSFCQMCLWLSKLQEVYRNLENFNIILYNFLHLIKIKL